MVKRVLFFIMFCVVSASFLSFNTTAERDNIYHSIDFQGNPIDKFVFDYAFHGYEKLDQSGKLKNNQILSIIDYSKHSVEKRFWVIDLVNKRLLFNEWVSHGKYSGGAVSNRFSNKVQSKQTSLGFFTTGYIYNGKHARSLKLYGVEKGFNDNAFNRGIVIHGADYVSQSFINQNKRLGRSYGCPAVRQDVKDALINTIKDGTCLFSYYPSEQYLSLSRYIK